MTTARSRTACLLLGVALVGSACTGEEAAPEATPQEVLTEAKRNLDETPGVHVALSTQRLPQGVNGILEAQGVGTHAPAFQGDLTVVASGITADVPVIAVDDVVYAKLPFTTDYAKIDPADYAAPDPAQLMGTANGLSALLTEARQVQEEREVRDGEDVVTEYSATVPGRSVAAIIPSASPESDFDAAFTVDDDDLLRSAELTGPFYPDAGEVTYLVEFSEYGTEREITAP